MTKIFPLLMVFVIALTINIWASITLFKMGLEEGKKQVLIPKVVIPEVIKQTQESINRQCVDWFFSANFKQVKKDICKGSNK
jgi:hypothetical protein